MAGTGTGRCGFHSRYQRRVRDLSLGAPRAWLWIPVRRLQCPTYEKVRGKGFEFVVPRARVTRQRPGYIADLCRLLSVAEVARQMKLDWKLVNRCDRAVLTAELGAIDTSGLRRLAIDKIALLKVHHYMTVMLDYEAGRVCGVDRRGTDDGHPSRLLRADERRGAGPSGGVGRRHMASRPPGHPAQSALGPGNLRPLPHDGRRPPPGASPDPGARLQES